MGPAAPRQRRAVAPKLSRTLAGSVTLVLAVIHVVTIVFLHEDELIRNFVLQRLCGKFLIKTDN